MTCFLFPLADLKLVLCNSAKKAVLLQFNCSVENRTDGQCSLLPILFVCKMSQNLVSTEGVPTRSLHTLDRALQIKQRSASTSCQNQCYIDDSDDRMTWNYPSIAERRGKNTSAELIVGIGVTYMSLLYTSDAGKYQC